MKFRLIATAAATLMLAACGGSNDASTEAEAETVEMPADEALENVTEAPVADPSANAVAVPTEEGATEEEQIQDAGDNAAATAEAAMDAMEEETN